MKICVDFHWRERGRSTLRVIAWPFRSCHGLLASTAFGSGIGHNGTYIGEATQLKRRAYHYARPGPSQMTNIRLNAEMHRHLSAGGQIDISVITEATIEIDGHADRSI